MEQIAFLSKIFTNLSTGNYSKNYVLNNTKFNTVVGHASEFITIKADRVITCISAQCRCLRAGLLQSAMRGIVSLRRSTWIFVASKISQFFS